MRVEKRGIEERWGGRKEQEEEEEEIKEGGREVKEKFLKV